MNRPYVLALAVAAAFGLAACGPKEEPKKAATAPRRPAAARPASREDRARPGPSPDPSPTSARTTRTASSSRSRN
jgi:hypothetical protein